MKSNGWQNQAVAYPQGYPQAGGRGPRPPGRPGLQTDLQTLPRKSLIVLDQFRHIGLVNRLVERAELAHRGEVQLGDRADLGVDLLRQVRSENLERFQGPSLHR